jgi:4-amino-4-deoxy-L-arabinose transferase-like glycosyltransferase
MLPAVCLFLIWSFQILNNYIWLKLDNFPLLWDAGMYYYQSLLLSDFSRNLSFQSLCSAIKVGEQYPPLIPFIASLFYGFLPRTEDTAVFVTGLVFTGILIFCVYGITRILYSRSAGVLAAFLATMYPIVFGHSRVLMYDLPLAAVVCLSVFVFLKTNNFRRTGYSILFGVVAGMGLLTKFPFVLFTGSALVYQFFHNSYCALRQGMRGHGIQMRNTAIAVLIAIALAAVWYAPNWSRFFYAVFVYPGSCRSVCAPTFSVASFSYYFFSLINRQTSFFLFLIFVLGSVRFIRVKSEHKYLLIFWILFSYIGATLANYKSPRYTIAFLPAIAIISAIGLMSIRDKIIRTVVLSFVALISVVQFFAYSYGVSFLPKLVKIDLPARLQRVTGVSSIVVFDQQGGENPLEQNVIFRPGDWKTEEVLETITLGSNNQRPKNVFVIPDDPRIHSPLVSLALMKGMPLGVHVGSIEDIAAVDHDFVITKDGERMTPPYFMDKINRSVKWFEEHKGSFTLVKTIGLPDKSNLLIYKHK